MDFKQAFDSFKTKNVLIVGDVMVDAYIRGNVSRVSPEAPVPIVNLENRENRLGGAANVALNIASLGATPIICAVVGSDKEGDLLKELLQDANLDTSGVIHDVDRQTTVKTRIISDQQQLLRVDQEDTHYLKDSVAESFVNNIKRIVGSRHIDAIIFEDYNKGVLCEKVIEGIIAIANENKILTTVDPKKDNFFAYKNVSLFKPNLKELREGLNVNCDPRNKEEFVEVVNQLQEKISCERAMITLSEHGVFIKDQDEFFFIPAHFRNITDVSGAGDTVISVATLALAAGLPTKMIAEVANLAGGLVCEQVGVVSIGRNELLNEAYKVFN